MFTHGPYSYLPSALHTQEDGGPPVPTTPNVAHRISTGAGPVPNLGAQDLTSTTSLHGPDSPIPAPGRSEARLPADTGTIIQSRYQQVKSPARNTTPTEQGARYLGHANQQDHHPEWFITPTYPANPFQDFRSYPHEERPQTRTSDYPPAEINP